ncbi:hypothetical protein [Actibacterium pelagium]|uniref:Uncharacterized protein n=1 Tax=Actibacterium pelagium TaxID=2029103 RepID=A0A917EL90_9RHOB|nr:hypothetical protein [Actibacterium pelagium]GGE52343.1 hypothetical protein GCM10011517_20170 [Actibacterium pelagium]
MNKLIAIINVIAWSGFWAFGYLALSADFSDTSQVMTALLLAALGAGAGLWAYMRLIRINEDSGYAKPPKRAVPEQYRNDDTAEGGAL